jgi:alpha-1,4-digalacturonate transport system substrate-binding protein
MTLEIGKLLAASTIAGALMASAAMAETELRMMWYNDGNEGEVMQSLLDRFEAANPDISVKLDIVPYKSIIEGLPIQLAAGAGPDLARVTDLGGTEQVLLRPDATHLGHRLLGGQLRPLSWIGWHRIPTRSRAL